MLLLHGFLRHTDASSGLGIPLCLATNGYEIMSLQDKNHCKIISSHSTFTLHRTSDTLTLAVQRYWTVFLSSRSSRLQKKSRLAVSSISTQETTSKNRIWCGLGGVFVLCLSLFLKGVKLLTSTPTLTRLLT